MCGNKTKIDLGRFQRLYQTREGVAHTIRDRRKRIREEENPHTFYEDCDDGVPFIRFFDASGRAINPTKHGIEDLYGCDEIIEKFDKTIESMLKTAK